MSLPTGTITFLFTDIEGSTRLLGELGDREFSDVLARHHQLLRAAFKDAGGREIRTQGDAFVVTFGRATDAIAAAVAAQRALLAQRWPAGVSVRVRMGLHTGEPVLTETGYEGMDVHRAARICAAGHGGQILLSQATYTLAKESLPHGIGVRDLGSHHLKDLVHPQRLFQVTSADLPGDFPPLRSLDALPNNLPHLLTRFIGRDREIAEIERRLTTCRLLSLTGAGGCGKTRLAIEVAIHLLGEFADGVWMVELAPIADRTLVARSVATALRVPEQPMRPWTDTLVQYLHDKSLVLVLDNCEHLVDACAQLADTLLRSCPSLRIVATSREPLGIAGEMIFRVPSLSLPDPRFPSSVEGLASAEAVRLFVDRATLVQPAFALTDRTAPFVARICHQLDGIPLAIELAAARAKALSPEEIAERLDDRFHLLTSGSRTALPHHQTLRAAVDWSYDQLTANEQALLRQISVFAGGWTLRAAETVCAGFGIQSSDVLDLLTRLADKSLIAVEQRGGGTRYQQLATIRHYGRERLAAAGEAPAARARHRAWVLDLAERAEPAFLRADQGTWLDRLEVEHDNLRAALADSLESGQVEIGLRIASAVWRFWLARAYAEEGRTWLDALLQRGGAAPPAVRAKALNAAGSLALLGQMDYPVGRERLDESLAIWRALGHEEGIARSLNNLGTLESNQGNQTAARALYGESRRYWQQLGDKWSIALLLNNEGFAAFRQGDDTAARALLEESHVMFSKLADPERLAMVLGGLADVALRQRDYAAALSFLKESLAIRRDLGVKAGFARSLERFADFAATQGETKRAAQLLGAASAIRDTIRAPLHPAERADYDRVVAAARAWMGDDAFAAAWSEGVTMTSEQAIAEAMGTRTRT